MACSDYHVTAYSEGVPMAPPRRDHGCPGDMHRLSVTTNLPGGISYKWQIDGGAIVSTKDYYNYIFDNKHHVVTVTVSAGQCELIAQYNMQGRDCTQCGIECVVQTSTIPSGNILWLTDEHGRRYVIEAGMLAVCRSRDNRIVATAIRKAIQSQSTCENDSLKVFLYYNQSLKNCLTLTIYNSPVRFQYVRVDSAQFLFDKTKCSN